MRRPAMPVRASRCWPGRAEPDNIGSRATIFSKIRERTPMAASNAPASKSGLYADPREDWLALRKEEVLDPARPIVDPHHHLWDRGGQRYMIEEMAADIASGHNIIATVYVDCRSMYRAHGPEAFRPVGEVEFPNDVAAMSATGGHRPPPHPARTPRPHRPVAAAAPRPPPHHCTRPPQHTLP